MDTFTLQAKALAMQSNPDLYDENEVADVLRKMEWRTSLEELSRFLVTADQSDENFRYQSYYVSIDVTVRHEGHWLPAPDGTSQFGEYVQGDIDIDATQHNLARWIKLFGTCEKKYDDTSFRLVKEFGPHKIVVKADRQTVCRNVVVGVEEVPETVIPAHTKELKEWQCEKVSFKAILADDA